MIEPNLMNRAFNVIMRRMVETGQAPHYTEMASALGVSVEEGRKALHELMASGVPGWLYPGTDLIVSMAPFNNLPNQYRITVGGQQKWFGQWAFESLAVCWLFPGKTIRIDAPCLDCGEPIQIEIKDGNILRRDPEGVIGHVSVPLLKWAQNMPFAWSTMHFFRSEEHLRNWAGFEAGKEGGVISLTDLVKWFSIDLFRRRLEPDYASHFREYSGGFVAKLQELGKRGPYWLP